MVHTSDVTSLTRDDSAARLDVRLRPVDERRMVVAVAGDLDLATAPTLKTALVESLALGHCEIVLDLSALGHMDSTGLAVLIGVRERVRDGGRLVLAGASPAVLAVFKLTGLEDRFEMAATVEEVVGPATETQIQTQPRRLTADAQIAVGLLSTALPFAESRRAEAERWLRVLQAHGDTAQILGQLGVAESGRSTRGAQRVASAGGARSASAGGVRSGGRDPLEHVIEHAQRLAGHLGVGVIGTVQLLAAVLEVYGSDFDQVLAEHGTTRARVLHRVSQEASTRRAPAGR